MSETLLWLLQGWGSLWGGLSMLWLPQFDWVRNRKSTYQTNFNEKKPKGFWSEDRKQPTLKGLQLQKDRLSQKILLMLSIWPGMWITLQMLGMQKRTRRKERFLWQRGKIQVYSKKGTKNERICLRAHLKTFLFPKTPTIY